MTNETATVISVTPSAASKALELARRDGFDPAILRVRVLAGGCSGYTYKLSFEPETADDDQIIESGDLRVLVDPASAPIIQGSTLDFSNALVGGGLKMI